MRSEFNLERYLNNVTEIIFKEAVRTFLKNPKEAFFLLNFYLSCKTGKKIRRKYERKGTYLPGFLIGSITDRCNMNCINCAAAGSTGRNLTEGAFLEACNWKRIFKEAKKLGIRIFLLGGGEPFLRLDIIKAAAKYKDILFPIFTNGSLRNENYLKMLERNRNLFLVFSLEGDQSFTDAKKGEGMYVKILSYMDELKKKGVFFGVSIALTNENIHNATGDNLLSEIYFRGCRVVFFIEHAQLDNKSEKLALIKKERDYLCNELLFLRLRYKDMLLLSFPGDEKDTGGCLAAGRGFFHINPYGKAEPCPFSPYSDTDLKQKPLLEAIKSPFFQSLASSPILLKEHNGRCVL